MKIKILNLLLMLLLLGIPLKAQSNEAQAKLMAKRAAVIDAQRNLIEKIYGIQVDSGTRVKDFIAKDDQISGKVKGFIKNAEIISESYSKDGVYKVTIRIDLESLRKLMGKKFKYKTRFIEAVGRGAAGSGGKSDSSSKKKKPWYSKIIEAKGHGTIPNDTSISKEQKLLMAERAAKLDAYRNLIEAIKGVHVDAQTTVEKFMLEDDTIMTQIQAFVQGAEVVGRKRLKENGKYKDTYEVVLKIDLKRLKEIIKQKIIK